MLKADATRIAWFLSLQRISHFPKYFMAPPTFQQRGRKSVASNLDVTPGQGLSSHSERMAPAQRNGFPALAVPMLQQATSPVNGFDRMTILRLITEAGSLLPAGAARSRELWNSPRFVTAGQTLDGPSRRQEAARHQSSGPHRNQGVSADPGDAQVGLDKLSPLAPTQFRSQNQDPQESRTDAASSRTKAGASATFSTQPPVLSTEQPSSPPGLASQYQSPSPDHDGTAQGGQSQRNRPTVSTLHIDGSALGRWTVQHLERSLGKPSTGMTGVDPRAAVPRGRVAPF
jgi:hypothetical protein